MEVCAMDRLAAMAIGWLCQKAGEWVSGTNGNGNGSSAWKPTVWYQDDDAGRRFRITVSRGMRDGNWGSIALNVSPGVRVRAVSEYAYDGDFVHSKPFVDDECL